MQFYGTIEKADAETRMVYGYASTEAVDASGEIILKSAVKGALEDYMKFANIREMHQLSAVGTAQEASVDEKGLYLAAHVVDDAAWAKVQSGVYKGFSVGGKVVARDAKNRKTITKIALHEISLVDRPQNPEATFDVWKAVGVEESDMAKAKVKEAEVSAENAPTEIEKAIVADPVADVAPPEDGGTLVEKAVDSDPVAPEVAAPDPDPVAKANGAVDALAAAIAAIEPDDDVKKGLYAVGRFAEVLESISYLMKSAEYEREAEGDKSKVPDSLKSWLATGVTIFKAMSVEEADELIAPVKVKKAADADDLAKAAAEAASAKVEAEAADALTKAVGERDALSKALDSITERIDPLVKTVETLAKRLADVESQPTPPKTAGPGAAISKEADAAGASGDVSKAASPSVEDIAKSLDAMSPEERAFVLIKASHLLPQNANTRF